MNKLSVLSTRDFNDYQLLENELQKEIVDVFVVGGKFGADLLTQEFALEMNIPVQVFLPDYRQYGKSANYFRNLEMIENSSRVLIFWDMITRSPFNYMPYIKERRKSFRTVLY